VKCDERKPQCVKCSSTGRACEYFTETTTQGTKDITALSTPPSTIEQTNLAQIPGIKALELRGFEFFLTRTSPEITYFDSEFWQKLALQLSHSEPLVLHAAIAMGTLHENEESFGMQVSKDRMHYPRHRFAVAQYNRAILLLRSRKLRNDSTGRISTLTVCLIFVHIELLRGHYDTAIAHIRSGLRILQEAMEANGAYHNSIDSTLATAFARLDLQCAFFDADELGVILDYDYRDLAPHQFKNNPSDFNRLTEMRRQYDTLLGVSFKFWRLCHVLRMEGCQLPNPELAEKSATLLDFYRAYQIELGSLLCSPSISQNLLYWQSALVLKMHAIATYILTAVSSTEDEEIAYDSYLSYFAELVALAEQLIHSYSVSSRCRNRLPTLSTDMGIIGPLYLVASKCRESSLRKHAITLLELWPHREGFWDSNLVAKLARKIVEIEENETAHDSFAIIRTSNVFAKVSDDQTHSIVTYSRPESSRQSQKENIRVDI
jgi:hypothetical protein